MGGNLAQYKTIAFAISALYTGLAGALSAFFVGFLDPQEFSFFLSIQFITIIILGWLASPWGRCWGAGARLRDDHGAHHHLHAVRAQWRDLPLGLSLARDRRRADHPPPPGALRVARLSALRGVDPAPCDQKFRLSANASLSTSGERDCARTVPVVVAPRRWARRLGGRGPRSESLTIASRRSTASHVWDSGQGAVAKDRRDSGSSEHTVGTVADGFGNGEADGARGPEVDHQLEFCRRLDGQVGWLGALENSIHVHGCALAIVPRARAIGHEAPGLHRLSRRIDRWQPILRGERHELLMLSVQEGVRQERERPGARPSDRGEGPLEVCIAAHLETEHPQTQPLGRALRLSPPHAMGPTRRVAHDGHLGDFRDHFLQQRPPLCDKPGSKVRHSGDVATRPLEARDESSADWILDRGHDDGDRTGRLLGGTNHRLLRRHDDGDLEPDQFSGESGKSIQPSSGPAPLNRDILSLDIAEPTQLVPKDLVQAFGRRGIPAFENADPRHLRRLLRGNPERCRKNMKRQYGQRA